MTELALILVSAILVNNFVLVQFLGLCPFMGVSRKIETAIGLSLATTFVLTLAAMCSHILQRYVLRPLDLEYLRTIGFILVIAVVVQFTEMLVKKTSPLLYRVLGIFLPLITTNCIVLGVALLNANKAEYGFLQATTQGFGAGLGFSLVLVLSIAFGDQLKLLNKDPATVTKYSNPLGDLGAYLSQLSPQDKLNQAQTLVGQPISTLFPDAYPGNPPSRAKVMSAAARKYDLTPQLIGAIILAEQRDQTRDEDAKDYQAAVSIKSANTSIGLGQVVVSTAIKYELFTDLLGQPVRRGLSRKAVATLLASDEFNIFATARYIRYVANLASQQDLRKLPKTRGAFPSIDLRAYAGNPRNWPRDNVRALASEYTSRPWDDNLSPGWPMFVDDAYATFLDPGMRFP